MLEIDLFENIENNNVDQLDDNMLIQNNNVNTVASSAN